MTAATVLPPYMIFPDADGNPLEGGFIYIGQPGFEARTTPKASYFDRGMTIPTGTATGAAIRTMQGFPIRNGSPAAFYVDGDYSITVCNRIGSVIYSSLYATTQFDRGDVSVADFDAVGDGVTNDQTAFNAALAATPGPVYVPWTDDFYVLAALSESDRRRLYGPGVIRVSGVDTRISSEPFVDNTMAHVRVENRAWQPSKWSSVNGSLYNGAFAADIRRTGGWPTYGALLVSLTDSTAIPSAQFSCGLTSWATAQNMTGGSIFGMWAGANSPDSGLSQPNTGSRVIGLEVNAGECGADRGLQTDVGGTYVTIGVQSVPDVLPATDARAPAVYPGTFAYVAGKSNGGRKWHTGYLVSQDSITPGGIAHRVRGGSTAPNAPSHLWIADGFYTNGAVFGGTFTDAIAVTGTGTRGLNLSAGTFSGAAILMASAQIVSWGAVTMAGTSGSLAINTTTGGLTIPRLTTTQRDAVGSWLDGSIIYNTTVPAFQGRQGGAWVNL